MKKYIVIRNGHGILAEGNTLQELSEAYERFAAKPPADVGRLPRFSALSVCHREQEDGKLCILNTEENPDAGRSYYNVGFEGDGAAGNDVEQEFQKR